jgi:hypothetical protein
MAEETVTVREVFELPKQDEPDPEPGRWEAVEKRIKDEVKNVKFPAALHDLGPKICELFNVPLPDILVNSWKKVGDIEKLLEQSRNSPEEKLYLELAQHSINCDQKPHLEMRFKNVPVKKIEFNVKLLFNLKGFVLKVQNGAITEIQTGTCEVKGTIAYAGQVIVEKKLSALNLPGRLAVPEMIGALPAKLVAQTKAAAAN